MGKSAIIAVIILVASVFVGYRAKKLLDPPPLPEKLEEGTWWGPGNAGFSKTVVEPFTINVPDNVLEDLKYRLDNHRPFTPPLEGVQQQYGMNTKLLKEVVDYWRNEYDWKKREDYLNQFPQFTINIQGLDIHYIHIKPEVKDVKVLPLLIVHGWPGSVREFYDIIPILTTQQEGRDFVFEVIVPHIPGYGFSKPAVKPGLGPDSIALVFKNMMQALGHQKFYIQGGDFGSIILRNLAVLYPEVVLGFHSNMCTVTTVQSYVKTFLANLYPSFSEWYVLPEHYNRVFPVVEKLFSRIAETGYLHEQATKPDTLGVAMNESPIGLAAYILEKFTTGTNITWQNRQDGGLLEYFTYDDLLDNIMIYWITSSATTSFRLYSETFNRAYMATGILSQPIHVPTACARYTYDFYVADGMVKDIFVNLVQLNDFDGGHFAAFQLPEIFAKDVYDAVEKFEKLNSH